MIDKNPNINTQTTLNEVTSLNDLSPQKYAHQNQTSIINNFIMKSGRR
jgi:hypothetical protein